MPAGGDSSAGLIRTLFLLPLHVCGGILWQTLRTESVHCGLSFFLYSQSPPPAPSSFPLPPTPPLPPPLEQGRLGMFDIFLLCCHLSSLVCDISCGSFGVLVHHHLLSEISCGLFGLTKCAVLVHHHLLSEISCGIFGLTKRAVLVHHHLLSVIFLVLTKCDVLVCVRFHVVFLA